MTLKEMREAAAISQRTLAVACGTSQAAVAQWESGAAYPQAAKLPTLSKALGASEKDIIEAITAARAAKLT